MLAACTDFKPGSDGAEQGANPLLLPRLDESAAMDAVQPLAQEQPAAEGRNWNCLGSQDPPPPVVASPMGAPRLVQSVQFLSLATNEVIPGVSVRACPQRDVNCDNPVTQDVELDSEGWADLGLYEGFNGYLQVAGEGVMPTVLFYAGPLTRGNEVDLEPFGLVEMAVLPGLSGATGTPQDLNLGLVVLRSFDCEREPAAGVQFTIDRPGAPWYFVGGLPSSAATQTSEGEGLGGFINVEPGIAVVTARLPESSDPIARAETVLVRAGWMTALRFIPLAE